MLDDRFVVRSLKVQEIAWNYKRLIKLNEHLAALLDGLLLLHQPAHPRARVVGDDGWDGPQPRMMTYGRSSPVVALETVLTKVDEGVACFQPLLLLQAGAIGEGPVNWHSYQISYN